MTIDSGFILRQCYKASAVLIFTYIFVLLLWLIYLTKKLIKSNKILRGTKRHESVSETHYSVYNARTHVIKNRFMIAILVIEIITAILPLIYFYYFGTRELVWNIGSGYVDLNSSSNESNTSCMVDYRIIAIYHFPPFFLIPAMMSISFLLLLSMLSIHTYFLEMRYKICFYKKGTLKLATLGIVQSLLLIALCFSRFTVLFEPLLFVIFFLYDFVVYAQLVRRLKLTLRGLLLEVYTFADSALKFYREQREHRKYILFTYLFCFALLVPCLVLQLDLYFYLFSYSPSCILNIFFSFDSKMHFIMDDKYTDPIVQNLWKLNPVFILVASCLLLLPHLVYVVYWHVDRIASKKRRAFIYAEVTERLI